MTGDGRTPMPGPVRRTEPDDPDESDQTREMRFRIRRGAARTLRLVLGEFNSRYGSDATASDFINLAIEELASHYLYHWWQDAEEDKVAALLDRARRGDFIAAAPAPPDDGEREETE